MQDITLSFKLKNPIQPMPTSLRQDMKWMICLAWLKIKWSKVLHLYYLAVLSLILWLKSCNAVRFDMRKQGNKLSLSMAAALVQLWQASQSIMIKNCHDHHHQQCLVHKNKAWAPLWHFLVAVVKGFSAEVFAGQAIAFMNLAERPQPKVSFRLLKKHKTASWRLTYRVSAHISRNHCSNPV